MAEIKVEGANIVRRNLRKVGKDLPKGMRLIHQEIAGPVAALAKRKARRRSGRMAGTIRPRSTTTMARVEAGRGIAYGAVQHWGGYHGIEPNLYLTEAIEERESQSVQLYERKLGDWIDSVWQDTR